MSCSNPYITQTARTHRAIDAKFRNMTCGYDANGRMVNGTRTPSSAIFLSVYDALGNRVAAKVNDVWQVMVYDAFGKLVAEYGEPQEVFGSRLKYIQQDWQGSVRTVSNQNGYVISRTDHTAFGETVGAGVGMRSTLQGYFDSPETRQGYGLTERDEATGLDHTWFRKNENQAGRWTSPDPYLGSMSIGNPQSFNRYSYVNGDPVNFVDPSGLIRICWLRSSTVCSSESEVELESKGAGGNQECTTEIWWECRSLGGGGGWHEYVQTGGGYSQGDSPCRRKNAFGLPTMSCIRRDAARAVENRSECLRKARDAAAEREKAAKEKQEPTGKFAAKTVGAGLVGAGAGLAGGPKVAVAGALVGAGSVISNRLIDRHWDFSTNYQKWLDDVRKCGYPNARGVPRELWFPH